MNELDIKIKDGIQSNGKFVCLTLNYNAFLHFLNVCFDGLSVEQISDLFVKCSSKDLNIFYNYCIENKLSLGNSLQLLIEHLYFLGFGKLKVITSSKVIKIIVAEPHVWGNYEKLFGKKDVEKILGIHSPIFRNLIELYTGQKILHKEIKNIVKKQHEIDFYLESGEFKYNKFDIELNNDRVFNLSFNKTHPMVLDVLNKNYLIKNGYLLMSGLKVVNVPIITFFNLLNFMKFLPEKFDKTLNLIYLFGVVYENIQKNFKLDDNKTIFKRIIATMDLFGCGTVEFDEKENKFIIENKFVESLNDNEILEIYKLVISENCRGFYDKCFNQISKTNFISDNEFIFEKVEDEFKLSLKDQDILEKISYKSILYI